MGRVTNDQDSVFKIALGPKRASCEDPGRLPEHHTSDKTDVSLTSFSASHAPFPGLRSPPITFGTPVPATSYTQARGKQVNRRPCSGLRSPGNTLTLEFHWRGLKYVCNEGVGLSKQLASDPDRS
jgi:hypothetical protein